LKNSWKLFVKLLVVLLAIAAVARTQEPGAAAK